VPPTGRVLPVLQKELEDFQTAEQFAPLRKGHITTRQDIQFHHIPLKKAAEALFVLDRAGISTREACGNTVRNVTRRPLGRRPGG